MNIHLEDIPPRGDMRNYPWQRLVNAVKRACNVQVTAPLVMSQSMSGTVIGLNVGAVAQSLTEYPTMPAAPMYAVRNNGGQTGPKNAEAVVVLDTQIHRYPDDATIFALAENVVTIKQAGVYRFSYVVPVQGIADLVSGVIWIDQNAATLECSQHSFDKVGGSGEIETHTLSLEAVVAANDTFSLNISEVLNLTTADVVSSATYGRAGLFITKIRDVS